MPCSAWPACQRERRKAHERALALEEVDPFPFLLARSLGMTLAELDARVGYDEYLRWRAFFNWESWQREQARSAARLHEKAASA